jgi:hypothetical protein
MAAAVHRPARPLRHDADRRRSGFAPAFKLAETVRAEVGDPRRRQGEGRAPPRRSTPSCRPARVEVFVREIEVLLAPPANCRCPCSASRNIRRTSRLKYRFLDLRRETLHEHRASASRSSIRCAGAWAAGLHRVFDADPDGLLPEGARDFLVPSRIHPGKFYALPQAPQQYKQLLMVAGFDRYFQIAPCFRDEDPRADRLPGEFYQLDLEMSFVTQEDVFDTMEPVMRGVFEEFGGRQAGDAEFPRIPYAEAMRKYGSDKPDLRNPIVMQDVSEHFRGSGFKVFARLLASDRRTEVWAIPAKTGGQRAFCDRMNSWAQGEGQPGLGYIFFDKAKDETIQQQTPGATGVGARGPSPRTSARADGGDPRPARPRAGDAPSSSPAIPTNVRQIRRRGAHEGRRGAEPDRQGPVRALLDRRFPVLRVERGREEGRLRAQPVLDAAGRAGGAQRAGPADHQGLPVRHRLQRLRDRLRLIRNHKPEPWSRPSRSPAIPSRRSIERSAACIAPSSMARRRMAAWRPASTAS